MHTNLGSGLLSSPSLIWAGVMRLEASLQDQTLPSPGRLRRSLLVAASLHAAVLSSASFPAHLLKQAPQQLLDALAPRLGPTHQKGGWQWDQRCERRQGYDDHDGDSDIPEQRQAAERQAEAAAEAGDASHQGRAADGAQGMAHSLQPHGAQGIRGQVRGEGRRLQHCLVAGIGMQHVHGIVQREARAYQERDDLHLAHRPTGQHDHEEGQPAERAQGAHQCIDREQQALQGHAQD
mmetsp:Transcript_146801/g.471325  ORF Transcript_146801/g.471325 Transcript_146801/m.471325 type:complete len:236 (+) Transcript_146801:66-773(+)